jgi:hypothetical protein
MKNLVLIQLLIAILTASLSVGLMFITVSVVNNQAELHADIKMGAFSDIHAQATYDKNANNSVYCVSPIDGYQNMTGLEGFMNGDPAPLGRSFCNPPTDLFQFMLQKLKLLQPNLDVLFVTGDFIAHRTSNKAGKPYSDQKYDTLMGVHANLSRLLATELPDTMVIPTFGNNDFDLDD